jgi:uncharacterized protein
VRVVFDTSVLVSAAILGRSKPRRAVDLAASHGVLLISAATVDELNEVLGRPGFDRYLDEDERMEFAASVVNAAELVDVLETVADCRDPSDDKFLALAMCGKADCIVSSDPDLLVLHPWRGISILNPQRFLEIHGTEASKAD